MDAIVFRAIARELVGRVKGMRLEKIFAPLPDVWTLALGRAGYLILHAGRPVPFLILSAHKPDNPPNPGGQAMWLRKRLRDRRVVDLVSDWPRRRLALRLSPGEGQWLVLDLRSGPSLMDCLPEEFGREPTWPTVRDVLSMPDPWTQFPHLTPPLRRRLACLEPEAAQALLDDLRLERVAGCAVAVDHRGRAQARLWADGTDTVWMPTALDAAEQAYGRSLAEIVSVENGHDARVSRECRRIERALARLKEDRARLEAMVGEGDSGRLLQACLHGMDKGARIRSARVMDEAGRERLLDLRPDLTIRENMERFFARAAKGRRGLPLVEARAKALGSALALARAGRLSGSVDTRRDSAPVAQLPAKYRKLKIGVYRSSDGFFLLRGRDARANHQLVQTASPFDFWLHAQDGPGAHVIIKRDFPKQDVPETTILEAAALAALASHLKLADRGDVLLCLVQDIRTIKGASLGLVAVDKVLRVVRPRIEAGLDTRLRL